jgi:4-hydroxy-4-methyl-2-oxoglutarate aldolase
MSVNAPLGIVKRNIVRADAAAVEKMGQYGVATVHEAQGRIGLMQTYMRPIYSGARISGTAVTVLLHPGDNWMLHVVAEQIKPGDIVVAALSSPNTDGFFGDLLATSFKARGARGLIIDGGCATSPNSRPWISRSGAVPSAPRAPSRPRSAR